IAFNQTPQCQTEPLICRSTDVRSHYRVGQQGFNINFMDVTYSLECLVAKYIYKEHTILMLLDHQVVDKWDSLRKTSIAFQPGMRVSGFNSWIFLFLPEVKERTCPGAGRAGAILSSSGIFFILSSSFPGGSSIH
ncbi:hypothetical protein Tco_1348335, partial [Tanacetum coccineum]